MKLLEEFQPHGELRARCGSQLLRNPRTDAGHKVLCNIWTQQSQKRGREHKRGCAVESEVISHASIQTQNRYICKNINLCRDYDLLEYQFQRTDSVLPMESERSELVSFDGLWVVGVLRDLMAGLRRDTVLALLIDVALPALHVPQVPIAVHNISSSRAPSMLCCISGFRSLSKPKKSAAAPPPPQLLQL